jgi:hypothetical protein
MTVRVPSLRRTSQEGTVNPGRGIARFVGRSSVVARSDLEHVRRHARPGVQRELGERVSIGDPEVLADTDEFRVVPVEEPVAVAKRSNWCLLIASWSRPNSVPGTWRS